VTDAAGRRPLAALRFLVVVLVPAAVLMALEIVSSRLLAPEFGNSVYVWGSIIAVFLCAMSLGYVLGGRIADRSPELGSLGRVLAGAALFQGGTLLVGRLAVERIGGATAGSPFGTLVAVALLFGPATVLLATVSPFAVRFAARELSHLGGLTGNLFALSTGGSLVGTMAATFVLIPRLSLDSILAALAAVTALAAAVAVPRALERLALVALALAVWGGAARPLGDSPWLAERITPYQTLRVAQNGDTRMLYSDGALHGAVRSGDPLPVLAYARAAAALRLYRPQPRNALLVGLGSGTLGPWFRREAPSLEEVAIVEIDPAVAEIARAQLGFELGPGDRLVIEDGRRFLAADPTRWDWIYCDTYIGLSVPFHLATREFFELLRSRLTEGGVIGLNLAGNPRQPFVRAIVRTASHVFDRVDLLAIPASSNHLLIAWNGERIADSELLARAAALTDDVAAQHRYEALAASRLREGLRLDDVPVLVDGYAPVDALLDLGESPREALRELTAGR